MSLFLVVQNACNGIKNKMSMQFISDYGIKREEQLSFCLHVYFCGLQQGREHRDLDPCSVSPPNIAVQVLHVI